MSNPNHKISIKTARELDAAIRALDGAPKIVGKGDSEQVVMLPYKFSGGTRVALAKNKRDLKPLLDAWESEHQRVFHEVSPDGAAIPNISPLKTKFDEAMRPILEELHDVTFFPLKESDLQLDVNDIPATVIGSLWPILEL